MIERSEDSNILRRHLRRLEDASTALRDLRGLVAIDEVQRRPELFPLLRVLADRPRW